MRFRISENHGSKEALGLETDQESFCEYYVPNYLEIKDAYIYGAGLAFQNDWCADGTVTALLTDLEPDILNDRIAIDAIKKLQKGGYTAEDVEKVMKWQQK